MNQALKSPIFLHIKTMFTLSFVLLLSFIWNLVLIPELGRGEMLPEYIPLSWRSVCEADEISPPLKTKPRVLKPTPKALNSPPDGVFISDLAGGNRANTKLANVTCLIPNSDSFHWKFLDLREWQLFSNINRNTNIADRDVFYVINVQCHDGANISLPWPMKTEGVRELHVRNCGLMDRDILYQDLVVVEVENELQILEIRDSISIVDIHSVSRILENSQSDSINITSAFDCGQDSSLEIFIRSNFTLMSVQEFLDYRLRHKQQDNSSDAQAQKTAVQKHVKPEDRIVTDAQSIISHHNGFDADKHSWISENKSKNLNLNFDRSFPKFLPETDILELMRKIMNTHSQCSYKKLRFQDESMTSDSLKYLLQFLAYGSEYPVLEVMNYSMVGLKTFPRGLQQWRLHFPRLRYVDLSHNEISQVKIEDFALNSKAHSAIFNVQHNNITVINMDVLTSWIEGGNSHIDARNNPIHCGCDMRSFLPFLHNSSTFSDKLKQYEYIKVMKCQTPSNLKGRELNTLSLSSLSCPSTASSHSGWIIGLAIILAIFIMFTIIIFRFKAEIRILLYTRLHIRLPWDEDSHRNTKTYDAFVSYSNDDAKWVYQNIAVVLENPDSLTKGEFQGNKKANGQSKGKDENDNKGQGVRGPFKLCLHQRDFIAGMTIMDNIVESIEASRHTIIVLSPNFMRSHWAMEELRQAYMQSLVEKTRHLIVVLLEKIPDEDMDPLIKRCCKTFTYLETQDSIFKDRLIFSLTTKDRGARRRDRYNNNVNVQQGKKCPNIEIESPACYDNQIYESIERPSPPARELSNTSASSNTELIQTL